MKVENKIFRFIQRYSLGIFLVSKKENKIVKIFLHFKKTGVLLRQQINIQQSVEENSRLFNDLFPVSHVSEK